MPRMKDVLKSLKDIQKEPKGKEKEVKQPKKEEISTKKSTPIAKFSGLEHLRKAIQEDLKIEPFEPKPEPTPEEPSTISTSDKTPLETVIASPTPPTQILTSEKQKTEPPAPRTEPLPEESTAPDSVISDITHQETIVEPPPTPVKTETPQKEEVEPPTQAPSIKPYKPVFHPPTFYLELHKVLNAIVQEIRNNKPIDPKPLEKYIPQLCESINTDESLFIKAIQKKRYATWVVSHSVNVAIFSVKISNGLKYKEEEEQHNLALAALLHDVGMTKVPNHIIFKHGKLAPDEFDLIRRHPVDGLEIVKHLKKDYPFVLDAVYQEQEREDGSGYPQGLKGDQICGFAKVIGLADVFEALVHGRTYRDGFVAHRAIQRIIQSLSKQLNRRTIKALIDVVSIFPVGSYVELNSGEIAKVITTNKARPVRPIVDIIRDKDGELLEIPITMNLEEEPLIHITKPILEDIE